MCPNPHLLPALAQGASLTTNPGLCTQGFPALENQPTVGARMGSSCRSWEQRGRMLKTGTRWASSVD